MRIRVRIRDFLVLALVAGSAGAFAAALAPGCGSLPLEDDAKDGGVLPPGRYHPLDFALAEKHGPSTNLGMLDCRACHGGDLTGIGHSSVSCDSCHQEGWRKNCTYCHGGVDNDLGSPPRDLDGKRDRSAIRFPGHTAHVSDTPSHAKFDCAECHVKPVDVLTPGHVFDSTPARAELVFTKGLSRAGTFASGTGTCATLYCHGSGRGDDGTALVNAEPLTCAGCHPSQSDVASWRRFTLDRHRTHLARSMGCSECHAAVVGAGGEDVVDPGLHVNGKIEVDFADVTFTFAEGRCTGTCHGERHRAAAWNGN